MVKRRHRSGIPSRHCKECDKPFRPSKRSHLYHNATCKNRAAQRRRRRALKRIRIAEENRHRNRGMI